MAERPIAHSPVPAMPPLAVRDGWEISTRVCEAPLRLADATPLAKALVTVTHDGAAPDALGSFGRTTRPADGTLAIGIAPGEWLLLAAPGTQAALQATIRGLITEGPGVDVIDATHHRALFRLCGETAPAMLAKVCAIDLSDRNVPNGSAFASSVARAGAGVVRNDVGGLRAYLLHTEWSLGHYLWEALLDAGAEFGIDVEGLPADLV